MFCHVSVIWTFKLNTVRVLSVWRVSSVCACSWCVRRKLSMCIFGGFWEGSSVCTCWWCARRKLYVWVATGERQREQEENQHYSYNLLSAGTIFVRCIRMSGSVSSSLSFLRSNLTLPTSCPTPLTSLYMFCLTYSSSPAKHMFL